MWIPPSPENKSSLCTSTTMDWIQTVTRTAHLKPIDVISKNKGKLNWLEMTRDNLRWRCPPGTRACAEAQCHSSTVRTLEPGADTGAVVLFISLQVNFSPRCRDSTATPSSTRWTSTPSRWDYWVVLTLRAEFWKAFTCKVKTRIVLQQKPVWLVAGFGLSISCLKTRFFYQVWDVEVSETIFNNYTVCIYAVRGLLIYLYRWAYARCRWAYPRTGACCTAISRHSSSVRHW